MKEISNEAETLDKKSTADQVLRAERIAEEFDGFIQRISWHISNFQVGSHMSPAVLHMISHAI